MAVLLASLLLATIPVGYLSVVLPLYLNKAGLEPSLIGLLYSLSGLVTAGLVAFSGAMADRFGRRHFMVAGTALPIVSYVIFALTADPPWLVLASLLGGVGLANGAAGALTGASFDALLAGLTAPERRTTIFAWAQALWSIALGVGSALAAAPAWLRPFAANDLDAYRPPFIVLIALAALGTLVLVPLREPVATSSGVRGPRGWLPHKSGGVIARYAVALGLFGLGLGVAVQLLPLWLNLRFGVAEATLAPWFAAGQILGLSSVAIAPWLDRRVGAPVGVLLAQLAVGACLVSIAFVSPVFEFAALAMVLRNILANVAWPMQQSALMTAVVPEERATAAGVGFAAWGVANAAGPALAGVLIQNGSLALPIVLGSIAYIAGGLAFGFGFKR
jgi:MFS family permease